MAPSANALLIGTITDTKGRQQNLLACQEKGRWRLRLEVPEAEDHILHDVGITAGTLKALTRKAVRAYSDAGGPHHPAPGETVGEYANAKWTLTLEGRRRIATARVAESTFVIDR